MARTAVRPTCERLRSLPGLGPQRPIDMVCSGLVYDQWQSSDPGMCLMIKPARLSTGSRLPLPTHRSQRQTQPTCFPCVVGIADSPKEMLQDEHGTH